jgi:membrane-associated PAP2 superfamily phosphatase
LCGGNPRFALGRVWPGGFAAVEFAACAASLAFIAACPAFAGFGTTHNAAAGVALGFPCAHGGNLGIALRV